MSAETRGMTLKEYCIRSRRAELLQQWHYAKNDGLTPDAVTCHSRQKVWWIDRLGHVWRTAISNRTNAKKRTGCPVCAGNVSQSTDICIFLRRRMQNGGAHETEFL